MATSVEVAAAHVKITVEMDQYNKNMDDARAKIEEIINEEKKLQAQQAELNSQLKSGSYSENSSSAGELKSKLASLSSEEAALKSRLTEVSSSIKNQSNDFKSNLSELKNYSSGLNSLGTIVTSLKAMFLGGAMKTAADIFIIPNAQLEQQITSFSVLLGSYDKAQTMVNSLQNMANKTPFELTDLTKTTQTLLSYGLGVDDVKEKLTELGNLSQGNADKLNGIGLAYGQIVAKGRLQGQELLQMVNQGVNLLAPLEKNLGKTGEEISDMMKKGQISVKDVDEAIKSLTTGTGQFAGMMDKQAKTALGEFTTLKDKSLQMARDIGSGAFEELKGYMEDLIKELDRLKDSGELDIIAKEFGTGLKDTVTIIANVSKELYTYKDAIIEIITALTAYNVAHGASKVVLGTVTPKIAELTQYLNGNKKAINETADELTKSTKAYDTLKASQDAIIASKQAETAQTITSLNEEKAANLNKKANIEEQLAALKEEQLANTTMSAERKAQITEEMANLKLEESAINSKIASIRNETQAVQLSAKEEITASQEKVAASKAEADAAKAASVQAEASAASSTAAITSFSSKAMNVITALIMIISVGIEETQKANAAWDSLTDGTMTATQKVIDSQQKVIDTYNESVTTMELNKQKTQDYINTVKELENVQNKDSEQKERLKTAVDGLNSIYPELNASYNQESNSLNTNSELLTKYTDNQEKVLEAKAKLAAYDDSLKNQSSLQVQVKAEEAQIAEYKQKYNDLIDQGANKMFSPLHDEMDKTYKLIYKHIDAWNDAKDKLSVAGQTVNIFRGDLQKSQETVNSSNNSLKGTVMTVDDVKKAFSDAGSQISGFGTEIDKTVKKSMSDINSLSDATIKNKSANGMSKDEILQLIETYPELANKITQTKNGYKVEQSALDDLRNAKINEARTAIQAQIDNARQVIASVNQRIGSYNSEIGAISSLAQAQAQLSKVQLQRQQLSTKLANESVNLGNGVMANKNPAFDKGYQDLQGEEDLINQQITQYKSIQDLQNKLNGYNQAVKIAGSSFGDASSSSKKSGSSGGSGSKSSSSSGGETADERALRDVKFAYDEGEISATTYYNDVESIKNKYYARGTQKWQEYTLEVKKGREQIVEDAKKANEDTFNNTIETLKNNLQYSEDTDKATYQSKLNAYDEMRNYIINSYKKQLIDYKTYQENIREVDVETYKLQKEQFEQANSEIEKKRDDAYNVAVKQINNYYDDLRAAQEAADRKTNENTLQAQQKLYEGAVSREGQNKLQDIRNQIKQLQAEDMKAQRETQRADALDDVETKYNNLKDSQTDFYNALISGAETTAQKVKDMVNMVNIAFSDIGKIVAQATTNSNNTSYTTNINQNNNIYDKPSANSVISVDEILSRYSLGK